MLPPPRGYWISIVIRRDADPAARLEANVLSFRRPILCLDRLRRLRDHNRLLRGHVGRLTTADCRHPVIPRPYRAHTQKGIDLGPSVLPCKPDGVVRGDICRARLLPEYKLPAVGQNLAQPIYRGADTLQIGAALGQQLDWFKIDAEERSALLDQLVR